MAALTRAMTSRASIFSLIFFLSLGCGPTNFVDFCKRSSVAACKQLFRCNAEATKALYADQAACEADVTAKANCDQFAEVSCTLDGAKASTCLNDVESASCGSTSTPASCRELTCGSGNTTGGLSCRSTGGGSTSSSEGSSCSLTKSECSDGATYVLSSVKSAEVKCIRNDVTEKTFTDASFCGKSSSEQFASMKSQCGWAFP